MRKRKIWCCVLLMGLMSVAGCRTQKPHVVPHVVPPVTAVYDAAAVSRILGLPAECKDPIPQARDGEIIIYYGGWDLSTLRTSAAGKVRMWQDQTWYNDKEWKAEPGYYRLLLPVPGSSGKSWDDQLTHLCTIDRAWQPAPICVAATAQLVHLTETGNALFKDGWCRCAEALPYGRRAALVVDEGRVGVLSWDGRPYGLVFLGAARKTKP